MKKFLSLFAIGLMIVAAGCLPPPPEAPTFSDPSGTYGMSADGLHEITIDSSDPLNVIFYTLDGSDPVLWNPEDPTDPNYNMDGLATLSGSIPYIDMSDPTCNAGCAADGLACAGVCTADVGACYGLCMGDPTCNAGCDAVMGGCMAGCAGAEAGCVAACPPDLTAFTDVGTIYMMKMGMFQGCMAACMGDPTCEGGCPALLPVAGDETTTIKAIEVEIAFGQSSTIASETYTFDPTMHDGDIIVTNDGELMAAVGLLAALGMVTIDGNLEITGVLGTPIFGVVPPLSILGDLVIANTNEDIANVLAYAASCTVGNDIITCGNFNEAPCAP